MGQMQTIRGTSNTGLIPVKWATKYLQEQHEQDPLKPFYGSVVMTNYDLKADKGDKVVVPIVGLLSGAGVTDDGDYDGNIDSVGVTEFPVQVHEHGYAVGIKGQMSEKSLAISAKNINMQALTKWSAAFNARAAIDALSGMKLHTLGGQVLGAAGLGLMVLVRRPEDR